MQKIIDPIALGKSKFYLQKNKYLLIPKEIIPLTKEEWELLKFLTEEQNLQYFKAKTGDTKEALSMNVFRIKLAGDDRVLHEGLMNIIGSSKMLNFYREIANNDQLIIDRCQAHLYKEKDFISRHIDQESYSGYLYSILLAISEDFTGGEILLYKENRVDKFTIPYQSILFADCNLPHEVLPVESGIRKTIALFLMEKRLPS
jgi:hypothetical protein